MGLRKMFSVHLCMSRCYLEGVEQCLFSMVFFSCQSNELELTRKMSFYTLQVNSFIEK